MRDYSELKDEIVIWLRTWFDENGKDCNAVVAMSGGKDSTIVAALCVEALGKDRVIGVGIPDTGQGLNDADKIAEYLGIKFLEFPIGGLTDEIKSVFPGHMSKQTEQNIPPRLRMTVLYAVSQSNNGRVIGTCNASENYVGYFTRYGDGASDVEPIGSLTVRQVKGVGYALGLPAQWVDRIPDDGLPNSAPDDEKFAKWGFSYAAIDDYLTKGTSGDKKVDEAIESMHQKTKFKMGLGQMFVPNGGCSAL